MMSESSASSAFLHLHPRVQRWVWKQEWTSLRPTQEQAAPVLLEGKRDLIIAAATASGKTEAAFLPLISRLLFEADASDKMGVLLYIAPLKALINDQNERMELFTEGMEIPVTPWHGDSPLSGKRAFRKKREGVLLITPESLEALFVNHGQQMPQIFSRLQHVVIDELHSFIGEERGIQLQSLLHRLELALRRRIPRAGLSATLGDMSIAAEFLRPGHGDEVHTLISRDDSQELKIQVRGYEQRPPQIANKELQVLDESGDEVEVEDTTSGDVIDISRHLFKVLRGSTNLIFANSRGNVERYADLLTRAAENMRVPNEFFPHHGSLSKALREHAERALKDQSRPVNAICTSTLEMGIDIGSVESVAQIGSPFAVSSLRQRLGRSGRRNNAPAVLRLYIQEPQLTPKTALQDRLRSQLFQAVAMVELLVEGWIEPPRNGALHLSTMIQQTLSVIAEHGGASAQSLWNALCEGGAFAALGRADFLALLRQMGDVGLLTQSSEGLLLHGELGEKLVNHYSFYTAFNAPEEFTLANAGRIIGQLPIDRPVNEGSYLIFAGKRWKVIRVDMDDKRIDLTHSSGGIPPTFGGEGGFLHDVVRQKMRQLYESNKLPSYLDRCGHELFRQGREAFHDAELASNALVEEGDDVLLFPWKGDVILDTIVCLLREESISAEREGLAILAQKTNVKQLSEAIRRIISRSPISAEDLAKPIENKAREKYDHLLGPRLLAKNYATRYLDVSRAFAALKELT
ncbi:MAG: DEAD/DEAH box helicase [Halomonadaceae bacterium]|nr:MAG: DEAD/DEAH box helicase [Halomonadaceae bacterium]